MKALIIDDTRSIHMFVRELLQKINIDCHSVYNGAEALESLKQTGPAVYDLVLLDWEMPVLNGPETLKQLSTNYPSLPVVMMTTKNHPDDLLLALGLGAKEYIMKPFTLDILTGKISQLLGIELKNVG